MAAGACAGCLFRKQCPIVNTDEGRYVLEYTDRQRCRPPRRGDGASGLGRALGRGRLALAPRPRRRPVVSDHEAVPPDDLAGLE